MPGFATRGRALFCWPKKMHEKAWTRSHSSYAMLEQSCLTISKYL